jgi:hypothetical protein
MSVFLDLTRRIGLSIVSLGVSCVGGGALGGWCAQQSALASNTVLAGAYMGGAVASFTAGVFGLFLAFLFLTDEI